MMEEGDSINSAKITFTRYNDTGNYWHKFGVPQTLLMVRKSEMSNFFDKNKLTDNITSYYTTYNSTFNRYEYSNIARLIIHCYNEREAWFAAHPELTIEDYENMYPDWDKVMLVPVSTVRDSKNNIVNFRHDLSLNSTRLVGGIDQIEIKVISSAFNK